VSDFHSLTELDGVLVRDGPFYFLVSGGWNDYFAGDVF